MGGERNPNAQLVEFVTRDDRGGVEGDEDPLIFA